MFDVVANVNFYFLAVKEYESEESEARAFERRKLLYLCPVCKCVNVRGYNDESPPRVLSEIGGLLRFPAAETLKRQHFPKHHRRKQAVSGPGVGKIRPGGHIWPEELFIPAFFFRNNFSKSSNWWFGGCIEI